MKKPNVLNRSMFNQGGTSAYGKGITSNLVSDEQRQRFNYGGRVKLQYGTPWKDFGWSQDPALQFQYAPYPGGPKKNPSGAPMKDWWDTQRAKWNLREMKDYADENVEVGDDLESQDPYQGSDPRYFKPKFNQEDWGTSDLETPGDVPEVVEKEVEEVWGPGVKHSGMPGEVIKDDTDVLDTPDKWAFLDENMAKKKKLARGHALMEGAAAAAEFAVAATPEKRGAAVSKGLRSVGTIGAKYKGGAEDLKTKAQILGTIEDIKGEQKQKLFEDRRKGYYEPSLELQREGLELKKEAAKIKDTDAPPEQQYQAMLVKGLFNNPRSKADLVGSIIKKKIYFAEDKEKEQQYLNPDNNGLLFVDSLGEIWRNVNGKKEDVKVYEDTEFFGK